VSRLRKVVSVVAIKRKKILLVKKRNTWILPGGKPEDGESDLECLHREIKEELPGVKLYKIRYYGSFTGTAPNSGDGIVNEVYIAKEVTGSVFPSAEISCAQWVGVFEKYILSDVAQKVITSLFKGGHL
jgi:8-oxo-dGTP diphosphatase